MADIQTTVQTALVATGVPVFTGNWHGTTAAPAQYITHTARHHPTLYGDNAATEHEYTVYVEIWSDTTYLALKALVNTAMEGLDFNLVEELDTADPDTNHLSMTWYGVL